MRNLISDLPAPLHGRREVEGPASPLLVALPSLGVVLLVLGVGFAAAIAWQWTLAVAGALVVVALAQAAWTAAELGRQRRVADEWLLWGADAHPSSALLSWRAGELTSPRLQSALAHSLRRIEREVLGKLRPGPVPLNARALRRHIGLVRALGERLEDRTRPVAARGMVLVNRLLTEPGSPLYTCGAPDDVLADAIGEALIELDAFPLAAAA